MPDNDTGFSLTQLIGGLVALVGAIGTAYGIWRKTKTESRNDEATTVQNTVHSTLEAMKMVVDGLTRELSRRQVELDEARNEVKVLRLHERELEQKNSKQEVEIAKLKAHSESQQRQLTQLQTQVNRIDDISRGKPNTEEGA